MLSQEFAMVVSADDPFSRLELCGSVQLLGGIEAGK